MIEMDELPYELIANTLNQINKIGGVTAQLEKVNEKLERIAEALEYFLKEMDAEAERDIKEKLEGTKRIPPNENHYYKKTPNF